jgi:hypothetical protein
MGYRLVKNAAGLIGFHILYSFLLLFVLLTGFPDFNMDMYLKLHYACMNVHDVQ